MIQQGRKVVVRKQLRFSVLIAIKFDRTDEMRGKYPSSHPPPLKIRGWRVKKSLFIGWLTFFPPTSSFYSSSSSFFLFLFFFFFFLLFSIPPLRLFRPFVWFFSLVATIRMQITFAYTSALVPIDPPTPTSLRRRLHLASATVETKRRDNYPGVVDVVPINLQLKNHSIAYLDLSKTY